MKKHTNKKKKASLITFGLHIFNVSYDVVRQLLLSFALLFLLAGLFILGIGTGYFVYVTQDIPAPSRQELKKSIGQITLPSKFYYADGSLISSVQSDLFRERVKLKDVSPDILKGIIATEDDHFYEHKGFVPKAVFRALLQVATGMGGPITGGSTLTQQLVKQQILSNEVTFKRKASEILIAYQVEKYFTKDQILESYLNVSPFGRNSNGQNIAGIEAASQGIFGKKAGEVNLAQAAFLVGLPQNPYIYTPYEQFGTKKSDQSAGIARMKTVLYRMYRNGYINHKTYQDAKNYPIEKDFIGPTQEKDSPQTYLYQAIHQETIRLLIEQRLIKEDKSPDALSSNEEEYNRYYQDANLELSHSGYKIYTTVNKAIYNGMQSVSEEMAKQLGPTFTDYYVDEESGKETSSPAPIQLASALIENNTGKILGFVSGQNFKENQIDHAFKTRRSPGSTIKPLLVYGPAINENLLYPAMVVADTAISIRQQDGTLWEPRNYGGTLSNSFVSARTALKHSLNNPTSKIYLGMLERGIKVQNYFSKMGIHGVEEAEFQNPALAIGATNTGPTVVEQTSAYSTIGNKGTHEEAYLIEKIEEDSGKNYYSHKGHAEKVFEEDSNYLLLDMLRDVVKSGTAQSLSGQLNFQTNLVGKTGTSEAFKDIWFVGVTPQVTLSTWIGYDNTHQAHSVYPSDGYGDSSQRNLRYWATIANQIEANAPGLLSKGSFPSVNGVISSSVVTATGTSPGQVNLPNGRSFTVGGAMTKDIFRSSFPPLAPRYNLSIGASEEDLHRFWQQLTTPKKKDKKSDDKKDKKEKKDQNNSDDKN